jgi:hypothetical protein
VDSLLQVWAYEAFRIFHDRLVDKDSRKQFHSIVSSVVKDEWRSDGVLAKLEDCFYVTWVNSIGSGGRLPPFGKTLDGVKSDFIENILVKAINRFSKTFLVHLDLLFLNFIKIFFPKKMLKTTKSERCQ